MHIHVCMDVCVCVNIQLYIAFHNASMLSICTYLSIEVYTIRYFCKNTCYAFLLIHMNVWNIVHAGVRCVCFVGTS